MRQNRYITPAKMDKMLMENGYTKCCNFELRGSEKIHLQESSLGQSFVIRIDRYIDDSGKEASYAWNAIFTGIGANVNTCKPEYSFTYELPLWSRIKPSPPAYVINQGIIGYSLYKLTPNIDCIQ